MAQRETTKSKFPIPSLCFLPFWFQLRAVAGKCDEIYKLISIGNMQKISKYEFYGEVYIIFYGTK